jgi:hypothetical protein
MSARALRAVAVLAVALTGVLAHGQTEPTPYSPRLERPVTTTAPGPQRLVVDLPLLAEAAPFTDVRRTGSPRIVPPRAFGGLSDLRLFADDGREIGYLLVYSDRTPPMTLSLDFEGRRGEPGRSRYRVRLPQAGLPIVALTLEVGGEHVFRTAFVTEARLSGAEAAPAEIGRATLSRGAGPANTPGTLRIPILPPREPELDLVVDDGNNPPLDLKAIAAVFAELPWIYFEAPGPAAVARYGDAGASAPMYDLEAARPSIRIDDVPQASWGEPRPLTEPPPRPREAATPPPDPGAPIDLAGFRVERALPAAPEGLAAVALDAHALANSRGPDARFADVRIVDTAGRQMPYLVERRQEPLLLDLQVQPFAPKSRDLRPDARAQRSTYLVSLPMGNLPPLRLVLETSARVFQRQVQVGVERAPDRRHREAWFDQAASSGWQHADASTPAPPLTFQIQPGADASLAIVVYEGDNQPLPIAAARALLPSYRLRFYHPGGALRLVYGRDDLGIPQYDLALLGARVMGGVAREIEAGAPPDSAAPEAAPLIAPWLFWVGLGIAVVVLLALIARLMWRSG